MKGVKCTRTTAQVYQNSKSNTCESNSDSTVRKVGGRSKLLHTLLLLKFSNQSGVPGSTVRLILY